MHKSLYNSFYACCLCVLLLVTRLPVHEALWAQSKGFNVQGKASTDGECRVALVIGNAAYDMVPLRNPVNDARVSVLLRVSSYPTSVVRNHHAVQP